MATWIKLAGTGVVKLINLDAAACLFHDPGKNEIEIDLNGRSEVVRQKQYPVAYTKLLEYLRQIEQQSK